MHLRRRLGRLSDGVFDGSKQIYAISVVVMKEAITPNRTMF
jgi:hypothetical protein